MYKVEHRTNHLCLLGTGDGGVDLPVSFASKFETCVLFLEIVNDFISLNT